MTGDILKDSAEIFANIQEKAPVVHNISNYITATDCANMTLACGGSPTMADDPDEVEEIAASLLMKNGKKKGRGNKVRARCGRR